MSKQIKKGTKTPAKRKYVKKAARFFQHEGTSLPNTTFSATHENRTQEKSLIDEITFLGLTVEGVEQLTADQKSRFINYIYSRYSPFITVIKLTQ